MMNLLQNIEDNISLAKFEQAFTDLKTLCKSNDSENYQQVIILSSQYHHIQQKERIGLGEFNKELNRITFSLLQILAEEKLPEANAGSEAAVSDSISNRLDKLEESVEKILSIVSLKNDTITKTLSRSISGGFSNRKVKCTYPQPRRTCMKAAFRIFPEQ
ncbi:MAG: hypothetical protein R3B47_00290 [Bacteroidia bacterium]